MVLPVEATPAIGAPKDTNLKSVTKILAEAGLPLARNVGLNLAVCTVLRGMTCESRASAAAPLLDLTIQQGRVGTTQCHEQHPCKQHWNAKALVDRTNATTPIQDDTWETPCVRVFRRGAHP